MRERRRDYELMLIVSPLRSSEEDITNLSNRLTQSISSLGGELTDVNHSVPWGRRKFAYPIRGYSEGESSRRVFTEGYYILVHFKLPAHQVAEFERPIKLNESIMRYMLTLVDVRAARVSTISSVHDDVLDDVDDDDMDDED
jgi:small subunit ribosomal protein S6